ncbi:LysR substrate-binding domain-containing protein [Leucobacter luti]|uniref:LysR substrate-binding domain-containing protein n=1 Tax=Leucobacter luti TaxID=340320 RepID=UPI003CFF8F80
MPEETAGHDAESNPSSDAARPLVLGFARGIAPSKWANRWREATGSELVLSPVAVAFGGGRGAAAAEADLMLERTRPGERPRGTEEPSRTRHALRLYEESIGLVVSADHDLAKRDSVTLSELELVTLLDHPDHAPDWPAAEAWADPAWMPADVAAALALVATGAGAILLPIPLARHLSSKKEHAILPITGEPRLACTSVWATWALERDAADVQQLAGILRGRTARSSRGSDGGRSGSEKSRSRGRSSGGSKASGKTAAKTPAKTSAKKQGPKPGTRGAQLANAKWKPKPKPRPKPRRS